MTRPLALIAAIVAVLVGIVTYTALRSVALTVLAAAIALSVVIVIGRRLLPRDAAPPAPDVPGVQVDEDISQPPITELDLDLEYGEAMPSAPAAAPDITGVFPFDDGPIMDGLPDGERHDH